MLNDPLEEILQRKTPEERFALKAQTCKGNNACRCLKCQPAPRSEYYEHDYQKCQRFGGIGPMSSAF